ncbi:MAG TPA: MarR family winged helix-turn-helix transcriptional regulator [Burkholderiaceae bacterium]|nr:MarR family winged helix-turn-helix transcriptional regulator [Burkholderiaceae bacterium]
MARVLDESVFFKLVRVVNLTARPFNEGIGRRHLLPLNDWRVMAVIGSHPGCAAADVCVRTGMDKMSVSRAIASLARRQRVLRKPDPADGRRTQLRLSAQGQRLFDTLAEGARTRERQLFGGVSESEQAQLAATLDRLVEGLLAADAKGA